MILFFDIETSGNKEQFDRLIEVNPPSPDGRLKDPEKVAADIDAKITEMWDKAALDADTGRVISMGWATELLEDPHVEIVGQPTEEAKARLEEARFIENQAILAVGGISEDDPSGIVAQLKKDHQKAEEALKEAEEYAKAHIVTERYILGKFWQLMKQCRGRCCGYNISGYDIPFIMRRSMAVGVLPTMIPNLAKFRTEPITDLMMILYNWYGYKGLKTVAAIYNLEVLAEGIDGSQVAGLTPDELERYQKSDVYLVQQLYAMMDGYYWPSTTAVDVP